jgi:UDP-N-acetylmuramoyl-L-alanyl-D-glutamate--2,6-diaminopimelate ligase
MEDGKRAMASERILEVLEPVSVSGNLPGTVTGLSHDSRHVRPGDWFFALAGQHANGARFASAALEAGAGCVVTEAPTGQTPEVRVIDARRSMARAAARFYGDPSLALRTVGITGTNGKTTVSFLLRAVLEAHGWATGLVGTVGAFLPQGRATTGFTTPESVELQALLAQMIERGAVSCVLEVSSHGLALERTFGLAFDVTAFTNLTHDHLDFHGTVENYLDAKLMLFDGRNGAAGVKPTTAVVHAADPHAAQVIEAARRGGQRVVTFAVHGTADVTAENVVSDARGSRFTVRDGGSRHDVALRLPGLFNVENALCAWAIAGVLGVSAETRERSLAGVAGVPGRLESVDSGQPFAVYVDYAHTPDALERLLETVRPLTRGRVHLLFGAGGDRDHSKRPEMGEVAGRLADRMVITSDNPRSEDPMTIVGEIRSGIAAQARAKVEVETDRRRAIVLALAGAGAGDVVVLAGKGHETTQTAHGESVPFDDREEARTALAHLGYSGEPR